MHKDKLKDKLNPVYLRITTLPLPPTLLLLATTLLFLATTLLLLATTLLLLLQWDADCKACPVID